MMTMLFTYSPTYYDLYPYLSLSPFPYPSPSLSPFLWGNMVPHDDRYTREYSVDRCISAIENIN